VCQCHAAIAIVLVLEKVWRVDMTCDYPPAWRGAALARARPPREFRPWILSRPKNVLSRRLPEITQRDPFAAASGPFTPGPRAVKPSRRSREPPVLTRLCGTSFDAKIRRPAGRRPKRLPSRRWELTRLINVPRPSRGRRRLREAAATPTPSSFLSPFASRA